MERPHYSADLRERMLQAMDAGLPAAELTRAFGISRRSLSRWRQWQRERGSLATKPRAGRPPKIAPQQHAALREQVAAEPDATLVEHCRRWEQTHGVAVSHPVMSRLLRRLDLPRKKNADRPGTG